MVDIFKALAEDNRLRILSLLIQNDLCVCEIESILNMTQSNASRHLTALKKSGILQSYKLAQWAYYGINDKFIDENKELYQYLLTKLKDLSTYQDDYKAFLGCREENICSNCKKPH
jgi:ArsR family transcriptional regulator